MLEKVKKKVLISLAFAGLLYLGFTIYADYNEVAAAFADFNWLIFPVLLALSMLNYTTRYLKWDYYLSILNVDIKKRDSYSIFMSGLIMSVTPGKMGELLKAFLVKQVSGTPVSKTAPVIFVERITDFISLMFIALAGAYIFDYGKAIVITVTVFFIMVVIVLSSRRAAVPILNLLEKNSFIKKYIANIHTAYDSSYQMLQPKPLILMTLLSLVSWFFECLGYHIILINFNIDIGILWASFSYAFATIIGAISMLPGGLGLTDGSLTFMIINAGYGNDAAVASTFIIRAVTLWFAVLVGIISVTIYQNRFGKITVESVSNQ